MRTIIWLSLFEPKELLARVKAVLRRSDTKESNAEKEIVFP